MYNDNQYYMKLKNNIQLIKIISTIITYELKTVKFLPNIRFEKKEHCYF